MSNSSITTEDAYKQRLINRLTSKAGLRGKVDAICVECVYDPCEDGTWRLQVANCACKSCPLYTSSPKPTN